MHVNMPKYLILFIYCCIVQLKYTDLHFIGESCVVLPIAWKILELICVEYYQDTHRIDDNDPPKHIHRGPP